MQKNGRASQNFCQLAEMSITYCQLAKSTIVGRASEGDSANWQNGTGRKGYWQSDIDPFD